MSKALDALKDTLEAQKERERNAQPQVIACGNGELVQDEPTYEQVKEYCHKRCLAIVDAEFLRRYASNNIGRKKGEWIKLCGGKVGQCSNCKKEYDRTFEYVDGWMYCPSCGAYMRGDRE